MEAGRSTYMSQQEPNYSLALEALDWAVQRTDCATGEQAPPSAQPADFRAAAEQALPELRRRLDTILMANEPEAGLDALLECGALAALLPAVAKMVGFSDGEWRHKDVWKHTKQVVRQAVPRLEVRWAALFHDIGKVKTCSITPDGQVHFFGHAEVGVRMFDKMERRLPLFTGDESLQRAVRFLILHHLRASQYSKDWTDSAVRRFAREMGAHLDDLICLSKADITTKRPERKRHGLRQISDLAERVSELARLDAIKPPLPTGLGNAIMEAFGIPPSRLLGDIMHTLETHVKAGRLPAQADAAVYIGYLDDNPSLLEP